MVALHLRMKKLNVIVLSCLGVAQEIKHQKTQLIKQREECVKKIKVLRRELEALRKQQREFLSEKSPERDTEHILIENNNLQVNKNILLSLFVCYRCCFCFVM